MKTLICKLTRLPRKALVLLLAASVILGGTAIIAVNLGGTLAAPTIVPNPVFYPKAPQPGKIRFINGSFEEPAIPASATHSFTHQTVFPGWSTRPTYASDEGKDEAYYIETQKPNGTTGFAPNAPDGKQYAELNAHLEGTLYQICHTVPGTKVYYEFYHSARRSGGFDGPDKMNFYLQAPGASGSVPIEKCEAYWGKWTKYTGTYIVPPGQTETEFAYESVSTAHGNKSVGNFLDGIRLYTPSYIDLTKVNNAKSGKATVGDVVTYTILAQNTGESDASNVKLTDVLPAGTELVPGSVKFDGTATSKYTYDAATRTLSINLGHDTATETGLFKGDGSYSTDCENSCTITFDIKVHDREIAENQKYENQAKVTYEDRYDTAHTPLTNYSNVSVFLPKTPDRLVKNAHVNNDPIDNGSKDNAVGVKIGDKITYEIEFESPKTPPTAPTPAFKLLMQEPGKVKFENGSFEQPVITGAWASPKQDQVPGWNTRPTNPADLANPRADEIEIQVPNGGTGFAQKAPDGKQYAELNATVVGTLYQNCETKPGTKVYYEFYHSARQRTIAGVTYNGPDVMNFYLRPEGATSGGLQRICSDSWPNWGHYTGSYVVPAGQTSTEFSFESVSTAHGDQSIGNYLDAIRLYTQSYLKLTKSNNAPGGKASVGDVVTYTVVVKNTGESDASHVKLYDLLPIGTELVPGSVKIDSAATNNYSYNAITRTLSVNVGQGATASDGGLIKGDGSYSTDCKDTYTVNFSVKVGDQIIAENLKYENQAKATYEDRYDKDRDLYTNYSNVSAFEFAMNDAYILTDVIPDGLKILSTSDGAKVDGQKVVWKLTNLPTGENVKVTVEAEVVSPPTASSGLYENTAVLSIPNQDDTYSNTTYHKLAGYVLHLRQIVLDRNDSIALPYIAYFNLENNGNAFGVTTDSNKDGVEVDFRDVNVTFSGTSKVYNINDIVPQYYEYDGFVATASYAPGAHKPADRQNGPAKADFSSSNEIWVTVYIRPLSGPGKHDWDFKTNDFGKVVKP